MRPDLPCFSQKSGHVHPTSSLSDWSWLKASLPISLGAWVLNGHPCTPQPPFCPPASCHIMSTLQVLISGSGRDERCSIDSVDVPLKQRTHCTLSKVIDQASFNRLLDESFDTRTKALALSTAIPHAGDWLHAVPSSALGLHFHDQEFHHCLQYWLGMQILEKGSI